MHNRRTGVPPVHRVRQREHGTNIFLEMGRRDACPASEVGIKRFALFLWLLLPLPIVVWHYGRGQKWLARDQAHVLIENAQRFESQKNWAEAEARFMEAA